MPYRSRQHKHGGGKFKSERQRRWMWANVKSAAKKWAHNQHTAKPDWAGRGGGGGARGRAKGALRGRKKK
jgi:hypothetical protein